MECSTLGFPVFHYLPKFAQTCFHWLSDAIQPSHPLSPSSYSALNLSKHQGLFQWAAFHIRWPKYWSFSISPSNEYTRLISFTIDWVDLLEVQGTLESSPEPQLESIDLSVFSLLHGPILTSILTTGKTIALAIWTSVSKVMSLLFNTLSGFVIAFLPRSKHLWISWLQSPSAVILEPKKIKSALSKS